MAGLSKLLGYFQLKEPNVVEREKGKVPGGDKCTCGPSTCLAPSHCPSPHTQAGGAAQGVPGCPTEGSWQGHCPPLGTLLAWAACAGSWGHRELIDPVSSPLQVIYKKFQVPCPLPEQEGNITDILNVTTVSTSDYQNGYTVLQAPEQDTCTPSFFTLNSQVRTCKGCTPEAPGEPPAPESQQERGSGCWQLLLPSSQSCSSLTDSVHHPHHGLRLRLPPRGPAHLHRAQGVSPGWGHPRGGVGLVRRPPKGSASHAWDLCRGTVGRWVL